MTALVIEALSVSIRNHEAALPVLDTIDLSLPQGMVLGLIGESGSGKTTLANAVLGVMPDGFGITGGRIRLHGETLSGPASPRRNARIAYVPQDPSTALDPLFTIGAQIDDLLRARRPDLLRADDRRHCAEAQLAAVRLPDPAGLLRRRPHEVSGGQRQRLMIALALMTRPALIVADEPTTALDLTIQAQVLALLRRLADQHGVAILLTTHDPGVVHEVCDHVAVMYRGRIVEAAPAATLLRQPRHPYTHRLLAARRPEAGLRAAPSAASSPVMPWADACAFHTHCSRSVPRCEQQKPQPSERAGHLVSCWQEALS